MAAHGCVLVAEHTSEMVGSARNNNNFDCADDEFDYDDEFDDDDKFDCADYHDDGCAAYGDNNNCCAEQQLWQQRHNYYDDIYHDDNDNVA